MAYTYKIGNELIKSPKKLYKQNGVYGHRKGDFFEPCAPRLAFKIAMAELKKLDEKK